MWKLLSVLLLLAAPHLRAQDAAHPDAEQARILALENAWNQAVQQDDAAALTLLLAPDLIYVEYDGSLMNRSEYLAGVQSPALQPSRLQNMSMKVTLYGAVAVVIGVCHEKGVKKNGEPYTILERFTDTWVRRNHTWVCIASQSTLIPR